MSSEVRFWYLLGACVFFAISIVRPSTVVGGSKKRWTLYFQSVGLLLFAIPVMWDAKEAW